MSNVDGDTLLFITDYFDLSLPIISVATFLIFFYGLSFQTTYENCGAGMRVWGGVSECSLLSVMEYYGLE